MRVCVLGGAGTLGALLMTELQGRGHDAVSVSRRTGADAVTGSGLAVAFAGADAVVDCLNIQTAQTKKAVGFFTATARSVSRAVQDAGVPHLVVVSIVGVEKPELQRGNGYYRGKAVQESTYHASGAPLTIVKSTQWFELASTFLLGKVGRLSLVPRMRSQPVSAAVVAAAVADVVDAGRRGGVSPVVAGPDVRDLADLARAIGASRTPPQRVLAFPIPGVGKRYAAGALLPGDDATIAGPHFEEWLAAGTR